MWDLSLLQVVPGLRIAAPRDTATLRAELREAVAVNDGPTVVRFPKASVTADVAAVDTVGGMDVLARTGDDDVLIVSVGAMASTALDLAERVADQGIGVTVVDPRWVKPLDAALPALAARHRLVVTIEDNGRVGGVGEAVAAALRDAGVPTPVKVFALPQEFLMHASRAEVLTDAGLSAQSLAHDVVAAVARLDHLLESRQR
jgi:1-deoxy-D-xylulose-5-phosphate synthase